MRNYIFCLFIVAVLTGCQNSGAVKVASGSQGPWVVTNDGAVYQYDSSKWTRREVPGTADDIEMCGTFLFLLTRPDSGGLRTVFRKDIYNGAVTSYPPVYGLQLQQIGCDGKEPVVLSASPNRTIYKYYSADKKWKAIHVGATDFSVMNGYLYYLYPTTTAGNVWSRYVDGGIYKRWGEKMVADKIAGDANGFPWVAVNQSSYPLYKWDKNKKKWTFGFGSGSVFDMDVRSYIDMYILSEPKVQGGGYTVWSHDLYGGTWERYPLPK